MEWGVPGARSSPARESGAGLDRIALVAHSEKRLERRHGRYVDDAVDTFGAEVALERRHDVSGSAVEIAGRVDAVAVFRQHALHFLDGRIGLAEHEDGAGLRHGRRLDPETNAGIGQHLPRKFLTRI